MREILERAKEAIGELTPLYMDCGRLCDGECCKTDEDGKGGVYLFPGEHAECFPWGSVETDEFGEMLLCEDWCDREQRPLACRIFPLTPVRNREGKWTVRLDARARRMCPLYRSGLKGMNPEFVRAAAQAIRIIAQSEEGEDFLERWADLEERYHLPF